MTHLSKVIILAGSLLVASVSIAANWVEIDDNQNAVIYANKDSIQIKDSVITYWVKWEYHKIHTAANGKQYISMLSYLHIDCKEKTYDITESIDYDKEGNIVDSIRKPLVDMRPIPPDSIIDSVSNVMCRLYQSNQRK